MPVFSFVCEDCNNRFETLVRSNADKPVCDKCGSDKLVKQVSRFAPAVPARLQGFAPQRRQRAAVAAVAAAGIIDGGKR